MYRKKMVITLISATVLFSAGTASVSLAAAGWQQKSGDWVYLDKDGNYLRDVWKKQASIIIIWTMREKWPSALW